MIKEYCIERIKKLQEAINLNEIKLEHNQISINKAKLQIEKIANQTDEATNIFSVIAREDNGFKNKEIAELESKILIYNEESKELEKVLSEKRAELDKVRLCLEELENEKNREQSITELDTSYEEIRKDEITDEKTTELCNQEIIDKLKFCKSIVSIDPVRANIEIDNIINKLSKK